MNPKQRAAEAALEFVGDGMTIGLGTGSTADQFLIALAAALKTGRLKNVVGVPTSRQSQRRSEELGIPLTMLNDLVRPRASSPTPGAPVVANGADAGKPPRSASPATGGTPAEETNASRGLIESGGFAAHPPLDVTIDGADEISPRLDLIKGLGGALLREKIVAQHSAKLVIIADSSKSVGQLGTKQMLPVEVVQFSHEVQADFLRSLGCTPMLRLVNGRPFITDNSNFIYDCRFPGIADPRALESSLQKQAGVVEHGLFLGMADVALIANEQSVETRRR